VHGDHRIDRNVEPTLIATQDFAPVPALLASAGAPVRQLQHRMLLGQPIVEAQLGDGKVRLLDARTAKPLPPVDGAAAALIARQAYRGDRGSAPVIERIERPSTEYRGALPAWRASFPDADETRIYVAAESMRTIIYGYSGPAPAQAIDATVYVNTDRIYYDTGDTAQSTDLICGSSITPSNIGQHIDWQSAMTHEMGHVKGMDHRTDGSTGPCLMTTYLNPGQIKRSLCSDERALLVGFYG